MFVLREQLGENNSRKKAYKSLVSQLKIFQNFLLTYSCSGIPREFNHYIIHKTSISQVPNILSLMAPSNFFNFLLVLALLFIHKRAIAEDDSIGYHGNERDALMALKTGFNNTFLNGNWTGIMCYMNNTPYWYGVQCLNGRVTGLILENMGLNRGIKVDALANLTELEILSFKNNSITGNMMGFTSNHKLRDIDLSENGFFGNISSSLINLNSLISLQLQDNYLTGPIPSFNQSSLKTFNVSYNNLSGKIPETKTLQSFDPSSYFGNKNLCGTPIPTSCKTRDDVSEPSSVNSSETNHNERFAAILVVVDVVVLVVIMFLFIIYYKKYKKLKMGMMAKNPVHRDEEHDSTIVERASEKRNAEGERGKLVFMEDTGTPMFDLDDLLKASAEGLGKGSFGNCYKAVLEAGLVVVVKRLRDLKPLNKEEFVRQVRAIADQKHPNLLPLLAYYYSKDEKMFLYRFASKGNLYNLLHGNFSIYFLHLHPLLIHAQSFKYIYS